MSEEKIVDRGITHEMRTAYIDYSMSVIVSRALPDVRDGLKPVHRRVLFGMSELGLASNRPTKKSARIVGEVLGKYHPHGDSAVYDTMVRMAQPWSLRYPLVDGQGNYGSIDGDSAAAMRYTEARLKAIAEEMLADIDKNTVDFAPNFDDSLKEPTVLPSAIPNLLVNGASGIAVGMATNMAPHNLTEVVSGIVAYIQNNDISIEELMQHIPAPDFPTGGTIYGITGVREAFETGRGRVVMRAKAVIENLTKDKEAIIVEEIPYQVNKATLVEKIAEMRDEKRIEGIGEVRDESNKDGIRVVIELKRDAISGVVLNNLYKYTQLQVSFGVNNVALVKGRPMTLNLKELIRHFVDHRHEVVVRRTQYELDEALARAHILEGLLVALDNLDEIIALIRAAQSPDIARTQLMERFELSEIQAKAILDMRLQRLTGLERDKIRAEYAEIQKKIEYYRQVLADEGLRMQIITEELQEVARKYGDERRSVIEPVGEEINLEDLIADEPMVITVSHQGYIKRTPLTEYRVQKRGGTGSRGVTTKDEDFVEHLYVASTHNYLLLFTQKGRCYWQRVYELPEGARTTKGRAIQNLIQIEPDDKVLAFVNVPDLKDADAIAPYSILMCTEQGTVKKTSLEAYSRPRTAGIIAININEDDRLLAAQLVTETSEVVLASRHGMACRFSATDVREMGRNSTGVRGIRLSGTDDRVVGMAVSSSEEDHLLVLSENGYGKRSRVAEYRKTNRGAGGVKTLNVTEKTGKLVGMLQVEEAEGLMIITQNGIAIRMDVADTSLLGRASQGTRLIRLRDDDRIASVAVLPESENDEETDGNENELPTDQVTEE